MVAKMIKKCSCGQNYENEGFKTMCPICFAKSKQIKEVKPENREKDIHRQVFVKIASEQLKGVSVKDIIGYAKDLEKAYDEW